MSDQIDDGGPAFPVAEDHKVAADLEWTCGMSLRDYAAIHASEPNRSDVVQAAGLGMDGASEYVYTKAESMVGIPFSQWWETLSFERRCELRAIARYAQADAMLAARKVTR